MIKNGRVFAYGLHHPLNDFTGFFFFYDVEPHQGRALFDPPLEKKTTDTQPIPPEPCIR